MDSAEEKDAHKRTGTSCIKASPGNLFESTRDKVTAYSDGQYSSPYFLKMGGIKNLQMSCLSKQIWELLLRKKVTVTAEYLPSAPKKHAGIESRYKTDSSDWKLVP